MVAGNKIEVWRNSAAESALLSAVFASLVLVGCGNAYERLEERAWEPVGQGVVPSVPAGQSSPDLFRPSVVANGAGREVAAGSAVHVRITSRSGVLQDSHTLAALPAIEGWFWIGEARRPNGESLVDFGSPLLRVSIVGLREGGTLAFYAKGEHIGRVALPRKGFLLAFTYKPEWRRLIPSGTHVSLDNDSVHLIGEGDYELNVVRVCNGELSRKTATLRQWGFVFNWGDAHYKFAREGLLEWVALDVDCGRGEKIRFEKGPAHGIFTPGYRDNPLLGWQDSYERIRR